MTDAERAELIERQVAEMVKARLRDPSPIRYRDGYTQEEGEQEIARLMKLPENCHLRREINNGGKSCVVFISREEAIEDVRREVEATAALRARGLIT